MILDILGGYSSVTNLITKRDGRVVPFDESKIRTAIYMSINNNIGDNDRDVVINQVTSAVLQRLNDISASNNTLSVETIQDVIVDVMKVLQFNDLAADYTSYRNTRTAIRDKKSSLMSSIEAIASQSAADCNDKRENANINGDTAMGTMLKFGTTTSKEYYLSNVVPAEASSMHRQGYIHIHDLDFYELTTTCCQIDIGDLLSRGFSTGHGHLRPPSNIHSAAALACIAIQSNQNDQHGGQSIPTFDYGLAPYVAKSFVRNIKTYLDMNEVAKDYITTIGNQLTEYLNNGKSIMSEEGLVFVEKVLYDTIGTDYVIPGMCISKAIKVTEADTYQAMEALVHNLNTMNCFHKTQKICVYQPIRNMTEFNKLSDIEKQALKNLLITLYTDEQLTLADIREELNIPKKVITAIFEYFEIPRRTRKENSEAVKNKLLRKFGVSNMMQLTEIKDKVRATQYANNDGRYAFNTEKQRLTNLERYGSDNPMTGNCKDKFVQKIQHTNLKRYGVKCSLQNPEVNNKARQTCFKRYGDVYVTGANSAIRDLICTKDLRCSETFNKARKSLNDKYDGHWGFGNDQTRAKIENTCLERYGHKNPALPLMCGKSKSEKVVIDFLKDQFPDIEIETNKRSLIPTNKRLEVDIYIPEYKFAIEINGDYSHNKDLYLDDMINETCYSKEMQKSQLLREQGIKLIHIWEDDLAANPVLKLQRILYRLYKWLCVEWEDTNNDV